MVYIYRGQKDNSPSGYTFITVLPLSGMDLEIGDGSKRVRKLMSEDYILIHFSIETYVELKIGDFVYYEGRRYVLTDPYKPSLNESTGGWDYDIRFDAQYYEWKNWKFKYSSILGSESSWSLTQTPATHLSVLLSNLTLNNAEVPWAFKFADASHGQPIVYTSYSFVVDASIANIPKSLTYSNVNLIDALNQMAQAWETEWWVDGSVIHLGKCELSSTSVIFSLESNVCSYGQSNGTNKYATRIYPFGSTRNIPNYYRKELIFTITKAQRNKTYVDDDGVSHFGMVIADERRKMLPSYFVDGVEDSKLENTQYAAVYLKRSDFEPPISDVGDHFYASDVDLLANSRPKDDAASTILHIPVGRNTINLSGIIYHATTQDSDIHELYVKYTLKKPNAQGGYTEIGHKEETISGFIPQKHVYAKTTLKEGWDVNIVDEGVKMFVDVEVTTNDGQEAIESEILFNIEGAYDCITNNATPFSVDLRIKNQYDVTAIYNYGRHLVGDTESGDYFLEIASSIQSQISVGDTFVIDGESIKLYKIPDSFFTKPYISSDVTNIITDNRLRLPIIDSSTEGAQVDEDGEYYIIKDGFKVTSFYIQDGNDPEVVEDIICAEEVYPKFTDNQVISEIIPIPYQNENVEGSELKTAYRFRISNFIFDKEWKIKDKKLSILFVPVVNSKGEQVQVSKLTGFEFEVEFNPKGVSSGDDDYQLWQIVPHDENGEELPSSTLYPQVGDGIVLLNWDVNNIAESGLIENAEVELCDFTLDYIKKTRIDPNTYNCKMMADYMYNDGDVRFYELGQKVSLALPIFGTTSRQSRIVGVEYPLDYPYDNPIYTVGESVAYSRIGDIENKLKEVNVSGNTYVVNQSSSGSNVNIVQSVGNDTNAVMSQAAVTQAITQSILGIEGYIGTTKTQKTPSPQELHGITKIGETTTDENLRKIVFAKGLSIEVVEVGSGEQAKCYLKIDGNVYSTGSMSSGGIGDVGGGGSGTVTSVTVGSSDVMPDEDGKVIITNALNTWVQGKSYATQSEVNAKYTKPSGGIPKTDLASAVQTSLGKADTALQSASIRTLTIQKNGTTVGSAFNPIGSSNQTIDIQLTSSDIVYALDYTPADSADLGTASSHAHADYVTAIGVDTTTNKLTWAKGGTAQTALTIPYATYSGETGKLASSITLWGIDFDGSSDINSAPNLYIGTTKVQSNSATQSLEGLEHVVIENNKAVNFKDSASNSKNVLTLNSSNILALGYGTSAANYVTRVYGKDIEFRTHSDNVDALSAKIQNDGSFQLNRTKKIWFGNSYYIELDNNGYFHTNAGFYSDSFVSAGGIGQGGSGGGGTVTGIKIGDEETREPEEGSTIVNIPTSDIEDAIDLSSYAKKSEIEGDKTYEHTQSEAAYTWTIVHNLNKYPSVTVIDSNKNEVFGNVTYTSKNELEVKFTSSFSGKAFCN